MKDGTIPLFQSDVGALRDPTNFNDQWRRVRRALGIPNSITGHSFRKLVVDLGPDAGLSAAIVADQVGQADPTETLRTYATRGRASKQMAAVIQNAVFPNQNIQEAEKWPRSKGSKISLTWAACSGDRI
ncbi:hypothetical protein [Nocardia sp. NBC_01009]|uniref:hypothetical protein n=1 Tax=Nocardia sp. NBC_01009 TaxID=2975996 RepID=UPI00386F9E03|nr:hypothetical protein OHA42_11815 [Nocardia sp. NBC_01009]